MKITILRGIPGSGKSTWASQQTNALVVSADHFFTGEDGVYRFNRSLLGKAHAECMKRFVMAVVNRTPHIIVDNTNINLVDFAGYINVGKAFDYQIDTLTFKISPETSFKRNLHQVPMKSCRDMWDRLERIRMPIYWGVGEEVRSGE